MKYFLAVALQLSIVGSAQACHPYINKYSQGCAWTAKHAALTVQPLPPAPDDEIPDARIWYVEISKLPPNWTLDERSQAIDLLKEQLNK